MTFGLGLGVLGIVFLYSGFKNLSIKQVIQGNTDSKESSASKFLSYIGTNGESADSPDASFQSPDAQSSGKQPMGVSIPKASWNPNRKPIANWIIPYLTWASKHGWHGTVTSGYRSRAEQTVIYNSGVRPAAKPGTSNHEKDAFPGGAVDVTNAPQLAQALKKFPGPKFLQWAGSKDPPHFSYPHGGSY